MLFFAPAAQAHLTLVEPMARTNDSHLTADPCGGIPADDPVRTYKAGSEIRMTVDLVVAHVYSFQAYISTDGFASKTELATVATPQ